MFKYILIMLLCLGGCATPVEGQEPNNQTENIIPSPPQVVPPPEGIQPGRPHGQIFTMHKVMQCNDSEVVENYIKNKFGQLPYTWGLNYNQMGIATMLTVIYVNPQTRTFSIIEHNTQKLSCILGTGQSFDLMDEELLNRGRLN